MTNEFLMPLDKNGYSVSIVPNPYWPNDGRYNKRCYVCGYGGDLARHEVFPGPYRQKSKRYGLWIYLCPDCHRIAHSIKEDTVQLKRRAQISAMNWYGWDEKDFIREFGKNYL